MHSRMTDPRRQIGPLAPLEAEPLIFKHLIGTVSQICKTLADGSLPVQDRFTSKRHEKVRKGRRSEAAAIKGAVSLIFPNSLSVGGLKLTEKPSGAHPHQ